MNGEAKFHSLIGSPGHAADLRLSTIRGATFALAAEGTEFVLRLVAIAVLARLLVPEYFGLIGMVTAITAIAERFKDLGLATATIQRKDITHEQVSTLFWVNAALGLAIVLLVAALAVPISHFYDDARLINITLAIASTFFWSGITIQHQALLRRQMRFARIAVIQVTASVLSIIVAITLARMSYGYWALVAREVSRNVFMAIGTWVCCPWVPGPPSRRANIKSMLSFGGDITVYNLIAFLGANLDQIVMGKIYGAHVIGLYRQGVNLVLGPIGQLTSPVNAVAESALSRLQSDPGKYRLYYRRILSTLCFLTMPLAAFLAVYADEIVLVVLGPQWEEAATFFRILALSAFIRPAASTPGFVMVTCGKSRRYMRWGLFSTMALVVFLAIGTRWGPIGVAFAQVASTYSLLLPRIYWGFKDTPVRLGDFASSIKKPLIASLIMTGILIVLREELLTQLPLRGLEIGALVALVSYFGSWLLLPGGRPEMNQIFVSVLSVFPRRG
jgi:O-antigen/teichoic acid export membrane protein